MFCRRGSKSDGSEVTEVTPPGNTATFTRVAVLLLLTTICLGRGYDDARVTPPHRHVRIGKRGQGITTAVDNSFLCVRAVQSNYRRSAKELGRIDRLR